MSKPFFINSDNNIHTVSWPTFQDIRMADTKIRLLKVLFSELRVPDAGLVIKYNQEEFDVMWISEYVGLGHPEMDEFIHDHYEIAGVSFHKLEYAEKFNDYLEKKFMWKVLSE